VTLTYTIALAQPEHLPYLDAIELAAAQQFAPWGIPEHLLNTTVGLEDLQQAQAAGLLWVALLPGGEPVGFALVKLLVVGPYLAEVDVHPTHGRRGLGRRLVAAVCEWAAAAGYSAVTLITFRDIPWNAPFYTRLGFRALDPAELAPELAERVRREAAHGLDPAQRVVMRYDIHVKPAQVQLSAE
jgi:GNAT superfamily N-acetyltransferase